MSRTLFFYKVGKYKYKMIFFSSSPIIFDIYVGIYVAYFWSNVFLPLRVIPEKKNPIIIHTLFYVFSFVLSYFFLVLLFNNVLVHLRRG